MKKTLLALALFTALPLLAEEGKLDQISIESSKTQSNSMDDYQKNIDKRTPIALGFEIGKQLTKAGLSCSLSTLEVLSLMAKCSYTTIEKASNDPQTNIDKITADAKESWSFLMNTDLDFHGENKVCIESAYKLRLSALTAMTKIYLKFTAYLQ